MKDYNAAIVGTMLYGEFTYSIDTSLMLDEEDITCPNIQTVESFSYSISHLFELWYIYSLGILVSSSVKGYQNIRDFVKTQKGKFIFSGVRAERNMYKHFPLKLIIALPIDRIECWPRTFKGTSSML